MSKILSALMGLGGIVVNGINSSKVDQWNKDTLAANERTNLEGLALMGAGSAENAQNGQNAIDQLAAKYGTNKSDLSSLYDQYFANTANDYSAAKTDTTSRYNTLIDQIQSDYAKERSTSGKAYEDLYNQQNAGFLDRKNEVMSLLEGMGDSEKADIKKAWKDTQAANAQNILSSGLSGTTIMPTMNAGITRDTNSDLAKLEETLRTQKAGTLSDLTADRLASNASIKSDQINADANWANLGLDSVNTQRTNQQSALDTLLGNNISNNTLAYGNQITDTNNLNQNFLNDWFTQNSNNNTQTVADQNRTLAWMQSVSRPYMDTTAASSALADSFASAGQLLAPQAKAKSDNSWLGGLFNAGGQIGAAAI